MKELTIEQKAKRYDEAKYIMEEYLKSGNAGVIAENTIKHAFPELKESKDEKIRGSLLEYLHTLPNHYAHSGVCAPEWIAWLKKQGEQRPADKVESNFEIGDLITNGILVGKIDEIHELGYHAYFGDHYADIPDIENWHKWTIQDAKDGDVLCSDQLIVLFKQWEYNTDYTFVIAYAGIDISGKLQITNEHWLISNKSKPATKEQRNLLFQKMKEAGYEWDTEKKELRKIEQKTAILLCIDECKVILSFLDTLEVKEADLKKNISDWLFEGLPNEDELIDYIKETAKHFFELGLSASNKAQKGE